MVVTDASLGNVRHDGSVGDQPLQRVFSQSAYKVMLGEASLINGETGKFGLVDSRSLLVSADQRMVLSCLELRKASMWVSSHEALWQSSWAIPCLEGRWTM